MKPKMNGLLYLRLLSAAQLNLRLLSADLRLLSAAPLVCDLSTEVHLLGLFFLGEDVDRDVAAGEAADV